MGHNDGLWGWNSCSCSHSKPFVIFPLYSPCLFSPIPPLLPPGTCESVSDQLQIFFYCREMKTDQQLFHIFHSPSSLYLCFWQLFLLLVKMSYSVTPSPLITLVLLFETCERCLFYLCLWPLVDGAVVRMLVRVNVSDLILVCINLPGIQSVILETCKLMCLLLCLSLWLQWLL